MAPPLSGLANLRDLRSRYGTFALLQHIAHRALNTFMFFECMNIIVLERERLRPLDAALAAKLRSRLATRADLEAMRAQPELGINATKLANFDAGDATILLRQRFHRHVKLQLQPFAQRQRGHAGDQRVAHCQTGATMVTQSVASVAQQQLCAVAE